MVKAVAARRGLSPDDGDDVAQEVMMAAITALREHRYDRKNRPAGEVAKLLGLSRNAVYTATSRVLGRLREKVAAMR